MENLICLAPLLLVGLATYLFQTGLQKDIPANSTLGWLILATLPLLAITYGVFEFARSTGYGGFLLAIFVSIATFFAALWLSWTLSGRRRLVALVLAIIFPAILFQTSIIGSNYSPEALTERNGDVIVQSLSRYRTENNRFPPDLSSLTPNYVSVIPEAFTTQGTGWLYQGGADHYTLGYWQWPDKFGATVCIYTSSNPIWVCDSDEFGVTHWEPFTPVYTPQPTSSP